MKKTINPKFGSGILTDSVGPAEQGKPSALGIFTMFWVWGFPCNRSWYIIATIFDLPEGDTDIYFSIKKRGSRKKAEIQNVTIKSKKVTPSGTTITMPIKYRFENQGIYEIICQFKDYQGSLKIPLSVELKDWPKFTKKEVDFAKSNPNIIKSFRVNVHCKDCQHAYIFEESVGLDSEPKGGVIQFPDSGVFKCGACNREMNLRDIQGQIRESLKETIKMTMRDTK